MKSGEVSNVTIAVLDVQGKGESFALTNGTTDLYVGRFEAGTPREKIVVGRQRGEYTHINNASELFDAIRKFSGTLQKTGSIDDFLAVKKPVENTASA